MARSRQFIDGWRHAEKSLVAWLYNRAQCMGDPRAQAILNVAADDFGKWAKSRYRVSGREGPPGTEDSLAVFRAAIRREALEEAAKIAESLLGSSHAGAEQLGQARTANVAVAIRAAKTT